LVETSRDKRGAIFLLDESADRGFTVMPYAPQRGRYGFERERLEAEVDDLATEIFRVLLDRAGSSVATETLRAQPSRAQGLRRTLATILRRLRHLPPRDDPSDQAEARRDAFALALLDYLRPRPDKGEDPAASREKALAAFVGLGGMIVEGEVSRRKVRTILRQTLGLKPGGRAIHFRAKIGPLMKAAATEGPLGAESHTQIILRLASGVELFHTADDKRFAVVTVGDKRECHDLTSPAFRLWLTHRFYHEMKRPPSPDAIVSALSVLESRAVFDSPERRVSVRVAAGEGAMFYVDLADAAWRAVRVGPDGWSVVTDPPERFRRPRGLKALPAPVAGDLLKELRPLVNVLEEDMPLLVAWLTASLLPAGPYPILVLSGEEGTAKSTLARLIRRMIDPHVSPLRSEPKETRDLMIGAVNSWCVTYDNLSSLSDWMSDSLCRLSTGGGFATRSLFSDADEVFLDAQRPVIITTIDDLVSRSDLADRCVFLRLPLITDARRRAESILWRDFDAAWPRLMGGLFSAIARGLELRDSVRLKRLPRLADFARWGEAVCRGLGYPAETFLDRYAANRQTASATLLDGSPIAASVFDLLAARGAWEGTPKALHEALGKYKPTNASKWPTSAKALASALRRLAPAIRDEGYEVTFGVGRDRLIEVRRVKNTRKTP
jgi:hypothetical protein